MSAKVISTDLLPYIKDPLRVFDNFIASGSLFDSVSPNKSSALSDHLNHSSLCVLGEGPVFGFIELSVTEVM